MSPVCGEVLLVVRLGQPEVGHPDRPLRVQEQVRRLDVAVQDPLLVGVLQRLGHLHADRGHALPVASASGCLGPAAVPAPRRQHDRRGRRRERIRRRRRGGGDRRRLGRLVRPHPRWPSGMAAVGIVRGPVVIRPTRTRPVSSDRATCAAVRSPSGDGCRPRLRSSVPRGTRPPPMIVPVPAAPGCSFFNSSSTSSSPRPWMNCMT